jgi:predicted Fe-Mo cluster-binding NifX family protein
VTRKFAVPTEAGRLCAHFGRCEQFAIVEVADDGSVAAETFVTPPAHQPGSYPRFLADQGVSVVLAGGMGMKAQQLFQASGIAVVSGVGEEKPRLLVEQYLAGEVASGANQCDHGHPGHRRTCDH